jgi:phosphorylase/glycogen(starch) synthase
MIKTKIKPDVLFECSWEVCNKVGGIYTVLSTKYEALRDDLGDRYIFIGPDVWKETRENPDFIEDKSLYRTWVDHAEKEGLRIRIGRWNIPGKPVAVLVDFTTLFPEKDKIFASFWETYKLDSLTGGWDYVEPALFGYAAGMIVESFNNYYLSPNDRILAHFHEWMTGAGILYLEKEAAHVATVFTTHATTLGRSITGNGLPLYSDLDTIVPAEMAKRLGVTSKHSLEMNSALTADSFTTVSEITARECQSFFGTEEVNITPNGFSPAFVPKEKVLKQKRVDARERILQVAAAVLNQPLEDDTMILLTSGRYEFRNKGLDVFLDAVGQINQKENLKRKILAIVAVPGNHSGPRSEVADRLDSPDFKNPKTNEYLTHNLYDRFHDPVINRILENNLNNGPESMVKVLFVPVYLDGSDGLFNMPYYDFLTGVDLTAFPSLYEPWGYTPLESIAFHIPTVTTDLAGFGVWVENNYPTPKRSVTVVPRNDVNYDDVVKQIAGVIHHFTNAGQEETEASRKEAFDISENLLWEHLAQNYLGVYEQAFTHISGRPRKAEKRPISEVTLRDVFVQDAPVWKKVFVRTSIPAELQPLKDLSMNLWWCWNQEAENLFREIDPDLWEDTGLNPVALLNRLSFDKLNALKASPDFIKRMQKVHGDFQNYMEKISERSEQSVGYFSMEYGLHESIKTYSGGLGVLAGDYLKEASDSNRNMVAVGLMYRYGYFTQSLSIFGDQNAESHPQKYTDLPIIPLRDEEENWVMIDLALPGRTLHAKAWKLQVGRIDLLLLDTDIEENALEDRAITHNLYGGDWDNRFKQELVLGVGGVRLLHLLNKRPTIYHLNEGHAAFAGLERLRFLVENKGMSYGAAVEVIRASTLFTTHTPVPAGHDTFTEDVLRTYIPHYADRINISWNEFMGLGRFNKNNQNEKFSMSVLAANLSQEMNGVSKIHGRVSREMFTWLYPGYFSEELHIGHVTNGVHIPTWIAQNWKDFYKEKLGANILENQRDESIWKKIHTVPEEEIWEQRQKSKAQFVSFLRKKLATDLEKRQENPGIIYQSLEGILDEAMYIGFARRFATYKRAHLLFTNLEKLSQLVNDPEKPLRFVFAGKAHPNDKPGQDLIKHILEISKRPEFIGKIIFLVTFGPPSIQHT